MTHHQIILENVTVNIKGKEIIKNVSFGVPCGKIVALIGPNGAGKSTVLKAILGQIKYTGRIHFCNDECHGGGSGNLRMGYVPQKINLDVSSPMTVEEFFANSTAKTPSFLSISQKRKDEIYKALSMVDATHLQNAKLSSLSGGEVQKILLAIALNPMPHILLLDEPVASVDVVGEKQFYELINKLCKDYSITVFLVSHDLSVVTNIADSIICLNKTVRCQGSAHEVITGEAIDETFGKGMGVYHHHD